MSVSRKLDEVYTIIYTLAENVKECPECFHDWFYEEIIDSCENAMDKLQDIFKYYKI